MDKLDYLNQISSKPAKKRPANDFAGKLQQLLHSKYTWIVLGGLAALVVIMLIGGIISGNKVDNSERILSLIMRIDNVNNMIDQYQHELKSSNLRGSAASLSSVLYNTNGALNNYADQAYKGKKSETRALVKPTEDADLSKLSEELFEAKITGRLDQVFAQRMAMEIATITSREEIIHNNLSNEYLDNALSSSYDSLMQLYPNFNDFNGT